MHDWAAKTAEVLRQLQQRTAAAANASTCVRQSLVRVEEGLCSASDAHARQLAVLEAEMAMLREQVSSLVLGAAAVANGGQDTGGKRRRLPNDYSSMASGQAAPARAGDSPPVSPGRAAAAADAAMRCEGGEELEDDAASG